MASNSSGSKTLMLFIGAIGFGIAAAIFSVLYLQSREKAILASIKGEEQQMVSVVVANQDLSKGQKVQPGLFAIRSIPATYVHPNAVTPDQIESFYGRFLVENISRGKTLLTNFMNETFPVDFSDLIGKGRRAITIQVDEVQSISGLVRPGNKIDIYVNIPTKVSNYQDEAKSGLPPGLQQAAQQVAGNLGANVPPEALAAASAAVVPKPSDVILPVLQDVRVLATGREAYDEHLDALHYPQRRTEFNFSSMTVDVSPEQAALLSIADDKGDLIAILRNRNDKNAADFTGITPFDLISNAREMKKQEAIRKAAEAAGATIDADGNWVTKDGEVIKKEDIRVSDNGTVSAKGGKMLASNGISINKDGQYVDANGNVIPPDQIVVNPDGSITTKDAVMKAAGYTVNENGDYVDANGNVVKKDDVKILANGSVVSSDGKVLAGPKVKVTKDGFIIAEDGTVMTADGKVLKGVAVNENGEVVGPDGKVLKDSNLTVAADGTVRDSKGNIISGVSGAEYVAATETEETGVAPGLPNFISLIIGGASKDGVAKTNVLLVQPLAQEQQSGQ